MVEFKAKDDDCSFLAWTTTPWTLPSNMALCVNPSVDYVKVQVGDKKYILAEALVDTVFEGVEGERKVLERYKGKTSSSASTSRSTRSLSRRSRTSAARRHSS